MTEEFWSNEEVLGAHPIIRENPFELSPRLLQARESPGLRQVETWNGTKPWLLCRHADVRAALGDARFSTNILMHGYPTNSPEQADIESELFIRMDGTEHSRRRRAVASALTPKRIEVHRPRIVEIVGEVLDRMVAAGGPADIMEDFALQITTQVICEILGVERSIADRVVVAMENIFEMDAPPADRVGAHHFVLGVIRDAARQKQDAPDESLLSSLVNGVVASGQLEFEEVVRMGRFLIGAGHETTANMIGMSTIALLRNPEQLEILMADPDSVAPQTVEELLRFLTVVQVEPSRIALEDIEIGGQLIRAGEGVVASLMAANRDPAAFGEGHKSLDELDATRPNISHHVAFGYGPHQCAGQNLARVELAVALPALFTRLPSLRLAVPYEELEFKTNGLNYGVTKLLVDW